MTPINVELFENYSNKETILKKIETIKKSIDYLKLLVDENKKIYKETKITLKNCKQEEKDNYKKYQDEIFLKIRDYKESLSKARKKLRNFKSYQKVKNNL